LDVRQGPYHVERTGSRPITEVKQHWARLVLGWVTAWESRVPLAVTFCTILLCFIVFYIIKDSKDLSSLSVALQCLVIMSLSNKTDATNEPNFKQYSEVSYSIVPLGHHQRKTEKVESVVLLEMEMIYTH
jgi:hypothetical protein